MTNKVQKQVKNRRERIASMKHWKRTLGKEPLKIKRGTARAQRRVDIAIFKAKQLARKLAELQGSTIRVNAPSLNINGYVTGKQAAALIKQYTEQLKEAA